MITRSISILTQPLLRSRINVKSIQPVRNSFQYRDFPTDAPRWHYTVANGLNAFTWWWIFTHMWYQFGHIVGEYDYPEPEKWTNSELGITDIDDLEY